MITGQMEAIGGEQFEIGFDLNRSLLQKYWWSTTDDQSTTKLKLICRFR